MNRILLAAALGTAFAAYADEPKRKNKKAEPATAQHNVPTGAASYQPPSAAQMQWLQPPKTPSNDPPSAAQMQWVQPPKTPSNAAPSQSQMGWLAPPSVMRSLVGKSGAVASALKPTGLVEIDGRKYRAKSLNGTAIQAGTAVMVVDFKAPYLLVQ